MNLPWWTFFTHELIVENVDMTDWEMLVEQFPGKHNFPTLGGPKTGTEEGRTDLEVHDDRALGDRAQRAVRLRRPHHAVDWSCAAT